MSVNKVILIGNVGQDPEISFLEGKRPMAKFSLATTERGRLRPDGTQLPDTTEWHRIVMFDHNAEYAEKYIRRGTKLYIEGKLRTRTWEDRNTIKHTVTEIYVDLFDYLSPPTRQS